MNVFTIENPIECISQAHQLGTLMMGGGPREEAPADDLDIAQASFELPGQILPLVKSQPHSQQFHFICSTQNMLQDLCCFFFNLLKILLKLIFPTAYSPQLHLLHTGAES